MGMKISQGVNRIRRFRQTGLYCRQLEIMPAGQGQLNHMSAMAETGDRSQIFMRWHGCGDKPDLLQITKILGNLGDLQMSIVNRIKGAAQKPYAWIQLRTCPAP